MTDMQDQSDLPTPLVMLESVLILITGAVLAGPILPGFTLRVAGLIVVAVAVPYLVVHSIRSIRVRRTAPASACVASPSLG